jgi:hypothetical protein
MTALSINLDSRDKGFERKRFLAGFICRDATWNARESTFSGGANGPRAHAQGSVRRCVTRDGFRTGAGAMRRLVNQLNR